MSTKESENCRFSEDSIQSEMWAVYGQQSRKRLTQCDGEMFINAYNKITNISKIVNGFKAAGIYHVDSVKCNNCFEDLSFDESLVSQTFLVSDTAVETIPSDRQVAPAASENEMDLNKIINIARISPLVCILTQLMFY